MTHSLRYPALLLLALLLPACTVNNYYSRDASGNVQQGDMYPLPRGESFDNYLSEGYARMARQADFERDFHSVEQFRQRSLLTREGRLVEPEQLAARNIPAFAVGELTDARRWLMEALAAGAAEVFPWESAQAQLMFDCWMEEQEENLQEADIEECKRGFYAAMYVIYRAEMSAPACPQAPACACPQAQTCGCPQATCAAPEKPFVLLFRHDSTELTDESRMELDRLVTAIREQQVTSLRMNGHADRSGAQAYNRDLSRKRLQTVITLLAEKGIKDISVEGDYFGESKPSVPTKDGVKELANRRVEVFLP